MANMNRTHIYVATKLDASKAVNDVFIVSVAGYNVNISDVWGPNPPYPETSYTRRRHAAHLLRHARHFGYKITKIVQY